MRIFIEPYNDSWAKQFQLIKTELKNLLLDLNPQIEHFGSTSIPGLAAKPIIDILVGVQELNQLDLSVPKVLKNNKYIYYKAFNQFMPNRRLFVRLKDDAPTTLFENIFLDEAAIPHEKLNRLRLAHIHIWKTGSEDWIRHIAFRDYLKSHSTIKQEYENIKKELSQKNWQNGMEYNDGKNAFIKEVEQKAIVWYLEKNKLQENKE